jgi:hypothetical protein
MRFSDGLLRIFDEQTAVVKARNFFFFSFYGPTVLVGLGRFFSSLIYT